MSTFERLMLAALGVFLSVSLANADRPVGISRPSSTEQPTPAPVPRANFWLTIAEPNYAEIQLQTERARTALRTFALAEASLAASGALAMAREPSVELRAIESTARGMSAVHARALGDLASQHGQEAIVAPSATVIEEAAQHIITLRQEAPDAFDDLLFNDAPDVLFAAGEFEACAELLRRQLRIRSGRNFLRLLRIVNAAIALGPEAFEALPESVRRIFLEETSTYLSRRSTQPIHPNAGPLLFHNTPIHTLVLVHLLSNEPLDENLFPAETRLAAFDAETLVSYSSGDRALREAAAHLQRGQRSAALSAFQSVTSGPWRAFAESQIAQLEAGE